VVGIVLPWCITVLDGPAVVVDKITDVGGPITMNVVVVSGTVLDTVELVVAGTTVVAATVDEDVGGTVDAVVVGESEVDVVGGTVDAVVVGESEVDVVGGTVVEVVAYVGVDVVDATLVDEVVA
jgi:hypothetical protein